MRKHLCEVGPALALQAGLISLLLWLITQVARG